MPRKSLRALLCPTVALVFLVAPGCGKGPTKTPAGKAETAVEEFLDAWTKGESPDKFDSSHPRISGTDPDWKAGRRLLSYLSVETKQTEDSPPRIQCRVALSLRDNDGKTEDAEVVYEIASGEKYVIRRAER